MNLKKLENSPYEKNYLDRVHQGDIYRGISNFILNKENQIQKHTHRFAVVISQECDLERDFKNRKNDSKKHDKYIPSLLLTPAYLEQSFRLGTHLEDIEQIMEKIGSERWKTIKENNNYRYHYLQPFSDFQIPELIIDFKHFFTLSRDYFYAYSFNKDHYLASLAPIFREDLSVRYCYYLSRIGLPEMIIPSTDNIAPI